jgi:hypothetical protein
MIRSAAGIRTSSRPIVLLVYTHGFDGKTEPANNWRQSVQAI